MFDPAPDRYRIDREAREKRYMERYDPDWNVINVSLLGLPRTLRQGSWKACDICNGVVFKATYEQCLIHGEDVWILSPVYGLVEPDATIDGTPLCLNEMLPSAQVDWACDVIGDLMNFYEQRELNVKLFGSPEYEQAFHKAMCLEGLTWDWKAPVGWSWSSVDAKLRMIEVLRG